MKSLFPGYYRPSDDEFDQLWRDATFSFDTNVLLNLYRLDRATADSFLKAFKSLSPRIWLPFHVAKEYVTNRVEVINEQARVYDKMKAEVSKHADQFKATFSRHPYIPVDNLHRLYDEFVKRIESELELAQKSHKDLTHDDPVSAELDTLFSGKVGAQPSDKEHEEVLKECERRFAKSIPPGNKDAQKPGDRKYGDAILWLQLIDHGKKTTKPIILITDDSKPDWWHEISGKTIGPRPELTQEMHEKAGVRFYLYRSSEFLKRMLPDKAPDKETKVAAVRRLEREGPPLSEEEKAQRKRILWSKLRLQTELARLAERNGIMMKDIHGKTKDPIGDALRRLVAAGIVTNIFQHEFLQVYRPLVRAWRMGKFVESIDVVLPIAERAEKLTNELRVLCAKTTRDRAKKAELPPATDPPESPG